MFSMPAILDQLVSSISLTVVENFQRTILISNDYVANWMRQLQTFYGTIKIKTKIGFVRLREIDV